MNLEEVYLRCGGLTREDLRKQNLIQESKIDQFMETKRELLKTNPDFHISELDIDELGVPDNSRLYRCIAEAMQEKDGKKKE